MNFNSQICTKREQSKRLIALGLKKETADMYYSYDIICAKPYYKVVEFMNGCVPEDISPAWSLHRLLLLIPKKIDMDGYRFPLRSDVLMRLDEADDMYEYLIGVLERTIKGGDFNKEYLV